MSAYYENVGSSPKFWHSIKMLALYKIVSCGAPGILFRYFELAQLTREKSGS
jgi:hypothetical protein